jgi:regulator of protease activity HflC (stomatin/prohibitin superfamily)
MRTIKFAVLGICLVFVLLVVASLFEYTSFYEHNVTKAARLAGLNTYLLKVIGLVFFIPFAYGLRLHPPPV